MSASSSQQNLIITRSSSAIISKFAFSLLIIVIFVILYYLIFLTSDNNRVQLARVTRNHFLNPSPRQLATSSLKTPIFTDTTIGLLNINSNARLQYLEDCRNEFSKLDLIAIPVGSSRVFQAMLSFMPHRLQASQLSLDDQISRQKKENSIKVLHFTPTITGEAYTVLPAKANQNQEFTVVGTISNSLYRDMSYYRINLPKSSAVGVNLLTNCEPGLILNHESSFFKFQPERIKIYAGIYLPNDTTSFHMESIIIAKNITVNTQQGEKDFYFGSSDILLDKPETQLTQAFTRLNTLLSALRGTGNRRQEKPIVCIGIRLTMTNQTQLNTREKVGQLFINHPIAANFSLVYLPNIQGFWNDVIVNPINNSQKVSINEMLFYILDAPTERNHFQMITTKIIEKYDLLCTLNWSNMYINNPTNHSYRGTTTSTPPPPPPSLTQASARAGKLMRDFKDQQEREIESLYSVYPPVETSSESETDDKDDGVESEFEDYKFLDNLTIPSKTTATIEHAGNSELGINEIALGQQRYTNVNNK
jgi:hypothetical protein